jgi:hypothetical protein
MVRGAIKAKERHKAYLGPRFARPGGLEEGTKVILHVTEHDPHPIAPSLRSGVIDLPLSRGGIAGRVTLKWRSDLGNGGWGA